MKIYRQGFMLLNILSYIHKNNFVVYVAFWFSLIDCKKKHEKYRLALSSLKKRNFAAKKNLNVLSK